MAKTPENKLKNNRAYYHRHKQEILLRYKNLKFTDPELYAQRLKKRNESQSIKESVKKSYKKNYHKYKDKVNQRVKEWVAKNRDKHYEYCRTWVLNNPDKVKATRQRHFAGRF